MLHHPLNWFAGWVLILLGFCVGAVLGTRFDRKDFLGGYDAFPRRLMRLGHIAMEALGMMNILLGLSPLPVPGSTTSSVASGLLLAGAILMPTVCFLTAWKQRLGLLFPLPVVCLVGSVCLILVGGLL